MVISTRQKLLHSHEEQSLSIKIGESFIPFVENSKILGVIFDNYMTWKKQTKSIKSKVNGNLYLLNNIKPYLPLDARILFYNSYILPTLDYCSLVWGNCSQEQLDYLFKLQKKAARIILDVNHRDYNTRSSDLLDELGWLPLADRIQYLRAVQVYKCVNGLSPPGLQEMFVPNSQMHSHLTRSAMNMNFYVPSCHTKSFSYIGTKTWNSLPHMVKTASSLHSFKRLCNNHYYS
jgi:hypothetical protein